MIDLEKYNSAEILKLIFDTTEIGICLTDKDRNFVKVNRAYCHTYGYEEHELLGQEFTIVVPDEDKAVLSKLHDDFIDNEIISIPGEWRVLTKSGELKNVWVTAARLVAADGDVLKITTVTDMSDKVNYLKRLEKMLSRNEELISEIHHRVKNNLNIITSLLYLYKFHTRKSTDEVLDSLYIKIQGLAKIHEKLYHNGGNESINLKEYLSELITLIQESYFVKKVRIRLSMKNNVVVGIDGAINVGLVINELITNAIKHAFADDVPNPKIEVNVLELDGKVKVSVADNGVGIDANKLKAPGGSLGLELVKNLSSSNTIQVDNNDGAIFTLMIDV